MPRVVFDSQVFAEQARGGVSRYFLNLAAAFRDHSHWRAHVALGLHALADTNTDVPKWGPRMRLGLGGRGFRLRRQVNRLGMMGFRPARDGATVYHPTWYHVPTIQAWRHLPITVTVHDLTPEKWPEVTDERQLADRAAVFRMARSIVCDSDSTRYELAHHYPEVASKATTALPGLPKIPKGRGGEGPGGQYIVHVGKRGAYKDFLTVLRAMARLPSLSLIAVGGGPIREPEYVLMTELGVAERVVFEAAVDDQCLADVICGAMALVSASRAEGFGLPPIEAAAQGVPSVLADIPAYREVHSRWATFFPPGDDSSLAETIDAVSRGSHEPLPDPAEVEAMFPWDRTVANVIEAYEQALS